MKIFRLMLAAMLVTGFAAAATAKDKEYTIAVIPKGTTHIFWKAVHAGAEKAGKEFGAKIIWQGPLREDDRNQQIQVVQKLHQPQGRRDRAGPARRPGAGATGAERRPPQDQGGDRSTPRSTGKDTPVSWQPTISKAACSAPGG